MFRQLLLATLLFPLLSAPQTTGKPPLDQIKLPPGFAIDIYSDAVPNARQMALGDKGTLFVGSQRAGRVYAVVDRDGDK